MAEEVTPSGLIVVTEAEKAAAQLADEELAKLPKGKLLGQTKKFRQWIGHREVAGVDVVTPVQMETKHKLSEEDRKQRRADNRAMAEIRKKTRGRKRHGRSR